MGKRAPKAPKKAPPKKMVEEEDPVPDADEHFEVFTPKFYETIDTFRRFYRDVLALKSKEQGEDLSGDFAKVAERVSGKLEEEANSILKGELTDIEGWINEQQEKVSEETAKIEEAYKSNAESLGATGAFSEEEIRRQLSPVQARIDEKKATYDSFGALLTRAKQVYE